VKGFRKSVNIWQSYGQEFGVLFFDSRCRLKHNEKFIGKQSSTVWNYWRFGNGCCLFRTDVVDFVRQSPLGVAATACQLSPQRHLAANGSQLRHSKKATAVAETSIISHYWRLFSYECLHFKTSFRFFRYLVSRKIRTCCEVYCVRSLLCAQANSASYHLRDGKCGLRGWRLVRLTGLVIQWGNIWLVSFDVR